MASWGRKSDELLTGTGSIDANTNIVIGANTIFTEEVEIRNVVDVGDGRFVVLNIIDDETLEVAPISDFDDIFDVDVLLSEVPKYLTVEQAVEEATLVTVSEAQDLGNRASGVKTPGWTLYKEYGDGRKRVETLVAMKQTSVI
jgi:hypothetical protein